MSSPTSPGPATHRPALDGLRGVAVLLVLCAHAANIGVKPLPFLDLSGCGRMGVFLFFVLSAYLLLLPLVDREDLVSAKVWGRYAARRVVRILPAYLAWVFVYFALRETLTLAPIEDWSLEDVRGHLLFLQADRHFWTLPVEMKWYAVLPLVALGLAALKRFPRTSAVAVILVLELVRWAAPVDYGLSLWPFLPVFLFGALVCVLHTRFEVQAKFANVAVLLGAVGLLLHVPAVWGVDHRYFHMDFDRMAACAGLVLYGCQQGRAAKILGWKPLAFVGRVSYSAYLGHLLLLRWVEGLGLAPAAAWGLFIATTLAVAWVVTRFLERPFLGLLATPTGKQ